MRSLLLLILSAPPALSYRVHHPPTTTLRPFRRASPLYSSQSQNLPDFSGTATSPTTNNIPATHIVDTHTQYRTQADINHEVSSGKILEGGEVFDFAGVDGGGSRAELALQAARDTYAAKIKEGGVESSGSFDRILGINTEVTKTGE